MELKKEGEACGSCYNPDASDFCGKCMSDLTCTKDPKSYLLPDLPSRCRSKIPGAIKIKLETVG